MTDYINGFLLNKKPEDLANVSTIDDIKAQYLDEIPNIDSYAGSSVTINNVLRAFKGLQEYHMNNQ
ncbi:hypothetical protein KHQ82_03580 [Mycoplasmatota bacterium]|nr:hypothetical protein KHQ82_03580 [Mycoplasmatota bacterium]